MSMKTASPSHRKSKPVTPFVATSTHTIVVTGRNTIPSTGQIHEPPNARSHRPGRQIQYRTAASLGAKPVIRISRQPMRRHPAQAAFRGQPWTSSGRRVRGPDPGGDTVALGFDADAPG